MFFCPIIPYVDPSRKMIDAITSLGLTSGLQLCLDAGDAASYTSGQVWTDRSGNGYNFNRGSGSGSDAADPTFNGSAGGDSSSEYWSFDGGDYFTLGQANPAWVNNIHKNNAAATLACWIYIASTTNVQYVMGDYSSSSDPMFEFSVNQTGNRLSLFVNNGSSTVANIVTTSISVPEGQWFFAALSIDEAAGSFLFQINGSQETVSATYSSPSSSNAGNVVKIGADGDGVGPLESGARLAAYMAWSTALSSGSLTALYNATKSKFGL